ncbi:MAG: PID-CTERM protein-sorting domain-containing protein [Cyclonatronaceae bacterium]
MIAFCLMFATIDAQAQRSIDDSQNNSFEWTAPDAPSDGSTAPAPPSPPSNGPVQTPIDGGLGFLLAAGGAYAVRRLRKKNDDVKTDIF